MNFSAMDGGSSPYVLLIVFGFLPSVAWKLLSAFVAHDIDENSEMLVWVRAVATTLLAGVASKLAVDPSGALALAPLWARLGALGLGLLAYRLAGRSVAAAVIVGEAGLMVAMWVAGV